MKNDLRFSATQAGDFLGELIHDGTISQQDATASIKSHFGWNPRLESVVNDQASQTRSAAGTVEEFWKLMERE